jgi:hypothetical protein
MMKANERNSLGVAVAVALLLLSPWAAGSARAADQADLDWKTAQPVAHSTYEQGAEGYWDERVLLCVSSAEQWTREMEELKSRGALRVEWGDPPAPMNVDWSRQSVVLVSAGTLPNYSHTVQVLEVKRHGNTLLVDVAYPEGYPGSMMRISPYHIVVVDSNGPLNVKYRGQASTPGHGTATSPTQENDPERLVTWGAMKAKYR